MDSNLSKLDITSLNKSLNTNTRNKPRDSLQNKKTNKTIHSKGLKSCAGTLILGVFMIGLLLALVGTMSSVQSRSRDQKVKSKLETEVDEKPVTLISTKFKVPATKTFDEFSSRVPTFKVDRSEKGRQIKSAESSH